MNCIITQYKIKTLVDRKKNESLKLNWNAENKKNVTQVINSSPLTKNCIRNNFFFFRISLSNNYIWLFLSQGLGDLIKAVYFKIIKLNSSEIFALKNYFGSNLSLEVSCVFWIKLLIIFWVLQGYAVLGMVLM